MAVEHDICKSIMPTCSRNQNLNTFDFDELRKSLPRTKECRKLFDADPIQITDFDVELAKASEPGFVSIYNDRDPEQVIKTNNKSRKRTTRSSPVIESPLQQRIPHVRRKCNTGKKNERAMTRARSRGLKLEWTRGSTGDKTIVVHSVDPGMFSRQYVLVMLRMV